MSRDPRLREHEIQAPDHFVPDVVKFRPSSRATVHVLQGLVVWPSSRYRSTGWKDCQPRTPLYYKNVDLRRKFSSNSGLETFTGRVQGIPVVRLRQLLRDLQEVAYMDETSLQMTKPQMKVSNYFRTRTRFEPAPVGDATERCLTLTRRGGRQATTPLPR